MEKYGTYTILKNKHTGEIKRLALTEENDSKELTKLSEAAKLANSGWEVLTEEPEEKNG